MGALATKLAPQARDVKVLTWDIENTPNVVHTWGLYNQNIGINQIVTPATTFAFAAKWYGQRDIMFHSDHHDGHDAMVRKAWELLDEADICVGFNQVGFDNKHMAREFILAGLPKPSPFKNVDLLRVARREFKFASNRLDHLAQQLGLGAKTAHQGHDLWVQCMAGDAKAWALMAKYNKNDVALTEKLYDAMRAWIPNHPHLGQFTGEERSCPNCGGTKLTQTGTTHANVTSYRLYRCDRCGTNVRGTARLVDQARTRRAN